VILTRDEELHISRCLESVAGLAAERFIVDSGSEDATCAVARQHGAAVFVHPFENQAAQFNWALDNLPIESEWVLRLDADEYLLPELQDEIRAVLPALPPDVSGLLMKRRVVFQGRWIRHGGYYPTWLLRLFRQGHARAELLEMDEHLRLTRGRTASLAHDFVDDNRKGLAFWTAKHERFAAREAGVLLRLAAASSEGSESEGALFGAQPERRRWLKRNLYLRAPLFLRAFLYFGYRYWLRLGFLDGRAGLVFHVLQGFWYRFYVDAKLWEAQRPWR
jgi:glycosyltransferase involved in cell wall biosynthesis